MLRGTAPHERAEELAGRRLPGERLLVSKMENQVADQRLATRLLLQESHLDAALELETLDAGLDVGGTEGIR